MLISSVQILSELLYKHYGEKTIILIDEYDVPLDKAFQNGYYQEMVALMRGMFGLALKTNDFLQFAVLTGCLRVSKESIFTGLNNFKVLSIVDARYDEIDRSIENLWSVLFTTGYLTQEWFKQTVMSDTENLCIFWEAFEAGERDVVEKYLNRIIGNSICRRILF